MKNLNREFEMDGFNVYTDEEMELFNTVENLEGFEYRYNAEGLDEIDQEAFKEYVREQMSEFYNQN